jgi:hypothetical protein
MGWSYFRAKLIKIIFKNSVPTSKKTDSGQNTELLDVEASGTYI